MRSSVAKGTAALFAVSFFFVAITLSLFLNSVMAQEAKRFEAWSIDCDNNVCQIFTSNLFEEDKSTQVSVSLIFDAKADKYNAILAVPERTALPPGLNVWLSPENSQIARFQYCAEGFCHAVTPLETAFVEAMDTSEYLVLEYVPYGKREKVSRPVFLNGFAEARTELLSSVR